MRRGNIIHAKFDMEKPEEKVTFDAVRKNPSRAAEFVAQMSPEELAASASVPRQGGEWKVSVRQVVVFRQKDMIAGLSGERWKQRSQSEHQKYWNAVRRYNLCFVQ